MHNNNARQEWLTRQNTDEYDDTSLSLSLSPRGIVCFNFQMLNYGVRLHPKSIRIINNIK